jgi:hypothetical protein
MFLAQSFKKFLKENFQEQEDKEIKIYNGALNQDSEMGLFNINDLITNPTYSSLLCNIYHDIKPLDNTDET